MDAKKFTGERPGWGEGFEYDYARHLAAYRFAATLAAGRRVLDAGCGEGFGTRTLAGVAAQVTGVDYSQSAIDECRRLWITPDTPDLRFERIDLTRPEGLGETFDVVLNFQVLEHIRQPGPFLAGLRALVGQGGVLVLTTPNRLRTTSENPYHVREYSAGELGELLRGVFGSVEMLGMHGSARVEAFEAARARAVGNILRLDPLAIRNLLPAWLVRFAFARLARLVRRRAAPSGAADIVPEDFQVGADDIDRALDLVALCRP